MSPPATPNQSLADILVAILVTATRMLHAIHQRAATAHILKTILAANLAGVRIGRAIRLTTLLIRRIQTSGLTSFTPISRAEAPNTSTSPQVRAPSGPRFNTGNGDAAFLRRPIPTIIAAIHRELHLAARALNITIPDHLHALCLKATLATIQPEQALPPLTQARMVEGPGPTTPEPPLLPASDDPPRHHPPNQTLQL